jgi:hypothetical protein
VIDATHLDFVLHLIEGTSVKHLIVIGQQDSKQEEHFGVTVTSLSNLESVGNKNKIERSDQIGECIYAWHEMSALLVNHSIE